MCYRGHRAIDHTLQIILISLHTFLTCISAFSKKLEDIGHTPELVASFSRIVKVLKGAAEKPLPKAFTYASYK
jgi:hypothetical protein